MGKIGTIIVIVLSASFGITAAAGAAALALSVPVSALSAAFSVSGTSSCLLCAELLHVLPVPKLHFGKTLLNARKFLRCFIKIFCKLSIIIGLKHCNIGRNSIVFAPLHSGKVG